MRKHPVLKGFFLLLLLVAVLALAGRLLQSRGVGSAPVVAVMDVRGVITDSREFIEQLRAHHDDARVAAVVVRIDSPGGAVAPSQEIYAELRKFAVRKPVVASMGAVAASGGYYIASAAGQIVANPGTITGSIGVIVESANIEKLLEKIGLGSVVVKSGKYKDMLWPTRPVEAAELQLVQQLVDEIHRQFIDAVVESRGLPLEEVMAIADGRIMTGQQARACGLVDTLGTLQDAIEAATDAAGLTEEPEIRFPEKEGISIWRLLFDQASAALHQDLGVAPSSGISYRCDLL